MMIDRMILRLPPEFAGREQRLNRAIADAFAERPLAQGQSHEHLAVSINNLSPQSSDAAIANQIVSRVFAKVTAG
jgi:hypothetical protein